MPELETSLESPEISTSVESSSTPVESPSETSVEAPETSEGVEGQEGAAEASTDAPPIAGGRLSEETKAALTALRASNPRLAAQLKNALYGSEELKKHFPEEGLKQAIALKAKFEELGGEEGYQGLKKELETYNDLDQKYVKSPGDFVQEIAKHDPEAFANMVPEAFGHYRKISPDGYSKYIGMQMVADMNAANIPRVLDRLADLLPSDNPKIVELFNHLASYLDKFSQYANQTVKPVAKSPEVNEREQQLIQREQELTRTTWSNESGATRLKIFDSEWKRLGGDKLDPDAQESVKELYGLRVVKLLQDTPKFKETIDKYFANGDKEGYLRYMQSRYRESIPKALLAAVRRFTPIKKSVPPVPINRTAATGAPVTPSNGFIRVSDLPKPETIDYNNPLNKSLIAQGKAVLKNGKRVQWR